MRTLRLLTLTLRPGPGYEVGTPSSATHYPTDGEAAWGTVGWESTDVTGAAGEVAGEAFECLAQGVGVLGVEARSAGGEVRIPASALPASGQSSSRGDR